MANDVFVKALKRRRRISITVTDRRTGRAITLPVWFVFDDRALWLLPANGSQSKWYRNLKKNRAITIQAGAGRIDVHARLLRAQRAVSNVIRQFRAKYTRAEIKRWYTRLDAAVQVLLPTTATSNVRVVTRA